MCYQAPLKLETIPANKRLQKGNACPRYFIDRGCKRSMKVRQIADQYLNNDTERGYHVSAVGVLKKS